MALNLNSILAVAAIIQSIFLSVFFFHNKKGSHTSNRIFGMLLFIYALSTLFSLMRSTVVKYTLIADRYELIYIAAELTYLFGPLLFFYIKSNLDSNFKFRFSDIIHLLPFIIMSLLTTINILFLLNSNKYLFNTFRLYDCPLMILHLTGYGIACILIIKRTVEDRNCTLDETQVKWLKFLLSASLLLWVIKIIILLSITFMPSYGLFVYSHIAYFIVLFIFFYWISFNALKHPEVLFFIKKYISSDLKKDELEEIKKKLIEYVEASKIYLNPLITITSLAKELSIPVPYLSRVINESFNLNFCDFINRYRVDESKVHLISQSKNKKTILEIAYSVGFNSKSSFYEAFKKQTGFTPTKFIQKNLAN